MMLRRAIGLSRASMQTLRTRPRYLAVGSTAPAPPELEMHKYHAAANRTLEHFQETLEAFVDEGDDDSDVDFSGDVLNFNVADRGTFVLNKQGPNKQIWLSSPISGPLRYDLDVEQLDWLSTRDHTPLGETLSRDISQLTGKHLTFNVKEVLADALKS
jgi:frataxin